jgi:hypothetical protein
MYRVKKRQLKRDQQGWFICSGKAFRLAERIELQRVAEIEKSSRVG